MSLNLSIMKILVINYYGSYINTNYRNKDTTMCNLKPLSFIIAWTTKTKTQLFNFYYLFSSIYCKYIINRMII